MMRAQVAVVRLVPAEAEAYNAFFRTGVLAHPDTLRIAPEDFRVNPFAIGTEADAAVLAVPDAGGGWRGVVAIEREQGRAKRRHIAWVLRMYVGDAHTGQGVGRALLRGAVAQARAMAGVEKVNLTVAAHNLAAVALYSSEGFREFAREDDAFRAGGPRTELSMSLRL